MPEGTKPKKYTREKVVHDLLRCLLAGGVGSLLFAGIGAVAGLLFYQNASLGLTPPQQGAVSILLMAGAFIMLVGSFLMTIRARPEKAKEPGEKWRKRFRCFSVPAVLLLSGGVMVIIGFAADSILRALQ